MSELASCRGKQSFDTYTQAQQIAERSRKRRKERTVVEPYRCRHCHMFRLAGPREKVPDRRRAE